MSIESSATSSIAIIGMAGRFPGAPDVETFWSNLCRGVEVVQFFSDEELLAAGLDPSVLTDPKFVRAVARLDDIDKFDASFFGYSPREAEAIDPQQRVFLECAWHALENAGYAPDHCPVPVGVFAGQSFPYYAYLLRDAGTRQMVGVYQSLIGTDKDFLPTRVSYKLDLRGPSVNIQTACSTSLVAVHFACQNLLLGECDMALAGGSSITLFTAGGYHYEEGGILSPDGHCRVFDAKARGTVPGDAVAVVVLKRLADALADGDNIRAVIRGTAANNDGASKIGYTAPSVDAQAEVIMQALAVAGVEPETIGYVEAHGTGTVLGDPIEIAALVKAFGKGPAPGSCAIGSVKSNMGHVDAAAGVSGLIKAAMILETGLIPPSLHFETPNPNIDFASSPFRVNTALTEWKRGKGPRRAGVSSFGVGGTNVHAVLEEAPPGAPSGPSRAWQAVILSAQTEAALEEATTNLAAFLGAHPGTSLPDAAYTLAVGRSAFPVRRMVLARDSKDAAVALGSRDPERVWSSKVPSGGRRIAFLFPGQGAQYVGMGRGLYDSEPVFREELDRAATFLAPRLGLDIRELLYPAAGAGEAAAAPVVATDDSAPATSDATAAGAALAVAAGPGEPSARLAQTLVAQPVLFAVEWALAKLLESWGVVPWAMAGHSLGEYVAATLSGVLSLEDALVLVAARGQLLQSLPTGAMLSVPLGEAEALAVAGSSLSLAAVNGPALSVVSGPEEAVAAAEAALAARGLETRRLHTSHAFHSTMVEPVLGAFSEIVRMVKLSPPKLPYLSNVTGKWIRPEEARDPEYWVRHLRQTVRFGDNLAELLTEPGVVLLEVGPGRALGTLATQSSREAKVVSTLRHPKGVEEDVPFLTGALGRLWLEGAEVDWSRYYGRERRRRVVLPGYPFEKESYWVGKFGVVSGVPATESGGATAAVADEGSAAATSAGAAASTAAGAATGTAGAAATATAPAPATASGSAPAAGLARARTSGHKRPDLPNPYVAPATDLEIAIAAVWREVLGIDDIGIHDDFFDLGGHSLMATRVLTRLREAFPVDIPLRTLFEGPTIAQLAESIEALLIQKLREES